MVDPATGETLCTTQISGDKAQTFITTLREKLYPNAHFKEECIADKQLELI